MDLKIPLLITPSSSRTASWHTEGFVIQEDDSSFDEGKLSISVGRFTVGHKHLQDPINPSASLQSPAVQQWLQKI
ncbi:hypothetical protein OG21DRAFT_1490242 [Imleria badia]|nr:hypothetical protein OG21DRAFT_1490242 [Imleria badia]